MLGEAKPGEGVRVDEVSANSPAAKAGLKTGDRIVKLGRGGVCTILAAHRPPRREKAGDVIVLTVRRDGKDVELKATLGERGRDGGRDFGPPALWKKAVFRLAVVGIEFPDVKHNAKVLAKDWEESLFSKGSYTGKMSATGQAVHGSLNDYFQEQSVGVFRVEGKVFEWVEVSKKRGEYIEGSGTGNKTAPLTEGLDKLVARDGKDALKDFDGFLFLYAGERINTNAGSLYHPHAGQLSFQSKTHLYLLTAEGGKSMASISAFAKEFGKVLGLPDLAARQENRGSEGLGVWCAMSDPFNTGRPQHLSAWAKEKIGWLTPVVIDPTVKQKLVLAPIESSPKECFKVLVRPDGSEYFLLENRRKSDGLRRRSAGREDRFFDLPRGGTTGRSWKSRTVSRGRPGRTVHLSSVPYPSASNDSFTPETTPSSRSPLGGGLPVNITEIRRLPDGRIAFHVGYEFR